MVFPVILGQGKRAFPDSMPAPAKLTVTNSHTGRSAGGLGIRRERRPAALARGCAAVQTTAR
jgi:hypothetical protein